MKPHQILPNFIFLSRWLQLPLYLGLIVVQALYAYHFVEEVYHLILNLNTLTENNLMLAVLSLIDIVLISNLLAMVIIGGYETFVSRLNISGHPDEPEWLDSVSTGTLKIKLSISLVSISSIHLLQSFIDTANQTPHVLMWQSIIVGVFVISALAIAWIDRISHVTKQKKAGRKNVVIPAKAGIQRRATARQ